MRYVNKALVTLCVFAMLFIAATCEEEPNVGPLPSEFDKNMREDLGDLIASTLLVSSDFPLLPNEPPYDSTVYWYVQTLYDQAIKTIRSDTHSPSDDRWSADREWKVYILDNLQKKNAYITPGGHLFVTTGMLLSFSKEYELYYVLTFEAVLMNQRHLLNRMITEYSALPLSNLINGDFPANGLTANIVAYDLKDLEYGIDIVKDVDSETADQICNTSVFNTAGILSVENAMKSNSKWLANKPSYASRPNVVSKFQGNGSSDCGSIRTNGSYKRYILDNLNL